MIVIGIDPGSQRTGWGIVTETSGVLGLVDCGLVAARAFAGGTFSERLAYIYHELCLVLKRHRVDAAAIEQVFTAQNSQSALKLGQARGVAVAACAAFGLEIHDYEPTHVKKSLTGVGRAQKDQVAYMVSRLLNTRAAAWELDVTDALAVAICHLSQARLAALTARARIATTEAG